MSSSSGSTSDPAAPEPPASPRRGCLVVVGTPLGNLDDLSGRARAALERADVIACEDSRRTGRLLQLVGLASRPLIVIEAHVERDGAARVVDAIRGGSTVALVTDAGMPVVSDPGAIVVSACVEAGLAVDVVPGPSSISTALAVSGMTGDRFVFEGFVPRRGSERAARLAGMAAEERVVVMFEAPHRVERTLIDLAAACGSTRRVAVCRELTKLHQEVFRGTLGEAVTWMSESSARGEYVVVIAPAEPSGPPTDGEVLALIRAELSAGATTRSAVAAVAASLGVGRSRVYDLALGVVGDE